MPTPGVMNFQTLSRLFLNGSKALMLFLASSFVMNCQRFEVENNREARESLFYTMTKSDDVDRYIDEEYIEDPGQFPVSPGDGCLKTLENDLIVETLDDSLYLFEGDILADEKGLERLSMFSRTPSSPLRSASIITEYPSAYYWPEGRVPYKMNSNLPSGYQQTVTQALNAISSVTPITFVLNNSNTYSDYLVFTYSSQGNNSYVGRRGGAQTVNIKNNHKGLIMHEIMHALGFYHEQSRSDRDSYISINWYNIRPSKQHNFAVYASGIDLGEFDFNSIMLYSSMVTDTTFVLDPSVPVMVKLDGSTFNGQRIALSSGDIDGVLSIYDIPPRRIHKSFGYPQILTTSEYHITAFVSHFTLSFYEDDTYSALKTLTHPARINLIKKKTICNATTHQLFQNESVETLVCQPGQSTYTIVNYNNVIVDLLNGQHYYYDVIDYELQ